MKTKTKNDALARALGRAHAALLKDLTLLEDAAEAASPANAAELRERLTETQSHIAAHFRFEEHNGYMDSVRKREPRFSHVIDELEADHRRLSASLDEILREASIAPPGAELGNRIHDWIGELTRHETRENDLVQDAFNSDVSAED